MLCPAHLIWMYMTSICYTSGEVNNDHLIKVSLAESLHWKNHYGFPIVKHKWFKTMQVSCLSSNFWSLILIPLVDLTWNSYYAGISIVIFYFSIPAWLVGIFHKKEVTFLLFPIYLFQYGIIFILFMGCNPITPTILGSKVLQSGAPGALSVWLLCPSVFPFLFKYDTVFHHRILQAHLPFFPDLDLKYTTASRFIYWQIGLRNQDPRPWYAHCYWGVIASRPSLLTKLRKYLCIY